MSVQLQLDSLPLLNCDWLKPGEKQLAIYGSCSSWPGGITDSLEESCFEPHAHPVGRPTSLHMKIQFCRHSFRTSHNATEQTPVLHLPQQWAILQSRATGQVQKGL